ncbi:MAG TPA: hypothetical protein VIU44_08060 [Gaiellaceae bacterium]
MSGGFQQSVSTLQAPAVEGDYASVNQNLYSVLAGPGGLVAGSLGVTIGRFAWATFPGDANGAPATVNNFGFGPVTGFVARRQQGLNTTYLSDASMFIPGGFGVTLHDSGDFWVKNSGASIAQNGMKAFANLTTGAVTFAAAGTNPGGASDSGGAVVNTTLTLVGGVSGNVLTVASVSAGKPYPGAVLGSNALGTVVQQLTNASGPITASNPADYGAGTYLLDVGEQSVAAGTTIGGNYGVYTVGTATGTFAVGMYLSGGTTLPTSPPPVLTLLLTGAGSDGSTFVTSGGAVAQTTHALVGNSAIETKWYARSNGLQNEVVKISSTPLG